MTDQQAYVVFVLDELIKKAYLRRFPLDVRAKSAKN